MAKQSGKHPRVFAGGLPLKAAQCNARHRMAMHRGAMQGIATHGSARQRTAAKSKAAYLKRGIPVGFPLIAHQRSVWHCNAAKRKVSQRSESQRIAKQSGMSLAGHAGGLLADHGAEQFIALKGIESNRNELQRKAKRPGSNGPVRFVFQPSQAKTGKRITKRLD